jgi:hypothetical protein
LAALLRCFALSIHEGRRRRDAPSRAADFKLRHYPTSDSGKLIGAALAGLTSIRRDGYRYKKAGVVLLDLHPVSAVREGLFDKADNPRRVDADDRPAKSPLRPRYGVLRRGRMPAAVEAASGVSVALLHVAVDGG